MTSILPRPAALLALLAAPLLPACTGADDAETSLSPSAPPPGATTRVRGTVVACGAPLPQVDVLVFDESDAELAEFATRSTASGRWSIEGLPEGTYRLELVPPEPDPSDPATELRKNVVGQVVVEGAETVEVPPVVFAPVVAGMLLTDSIVGSTTLQLREDPFDTSTPVAPGFEQFEFLLINNSQLILNGKSLAANGIDDDNSTAGRQVLVEVALLDPDQVPVPLVDPDGRARASQTYYQLYPVGLRFEAPNGTVRPFEVDLSNDNGIRSNAPVEVLVLDHAEGVWTPQGTSTVSNDGEIVRQDNFSGLAELGLLAPPGSPTPTTDLVGTVTSGGTALARAGIAVVTDSGFSAFTDEAGAYRIEGVPIPLAGRPLRVTAYTDEGLAFDTATVTVAPAFPETTADVELAAVPIAATPSCVVAGSEPADGSVDVRRNDPLRVRFDSEMDETTLDGAISVRAVPDGGEAVDVEGTVETVSLPGAGGGTVTDAFFLPDDLLPADAAVTITVDASAADVDGTPLAAGCTISFRTGTSSLLLPQVYATSPTEGAVETEIEIVGTNLDLASVTFDGDAVTPDSASSSRLVVTVPLAEGTESPGPRDLVVNPGGITTVFTLLPRVDAVQVDIDPDVMVETLEERASGEPGTAVAGVDQNDGTLLVLAGQNLVDTSMGGATVVTFGPGDGDLATTGDGDAAIDGPDESAAADRVDVRVPPTAAPGGLSATVEVGGARFTSAPVRFAVDLAADDVAPTVVAGTLDPLPGAVSVPVSQVVRVETDEPVAATSELLVGSGTPLLLLPGETRVTTSPDGTLGVLEFLPEAGELPGSAEIFVQAAGARVVDLAGNPVVDLDYTFDTAPAPVTLAAGPGSPGAPAAESRGASAKDARSGRSRFTGTAGAEDLASGAGGAAGRVGSAGGPGALSEGTRHALLGAALAELAGRASTWEAADLPLTTVDPPAGPSGELPGGSRRRHGTAVPSVEQVAVEPAGSPSPPPPSGPPAPTGSTGVQAATNATEPAGATGAAVPAGTRLRTELLLPVPGRTDPARRAHRFRLAEVGGTGFVAGFVADLDGDLRPELHLAASEGGALRAIGSPELVRAEPGAVRVRLPDVAATGERRPFRLLVETLDLERGLRLRSPAVLVRLDLP